MAESATTVAESAAPTSESGAPAADGATLADGAEPAAEHASSSSDRPPASTTLDAKRERLRPCLELIEAHLSEDLPVARAARTVAMSPSHFRRFFKQVLGQSYVRYLHARRIERACELIANSDLTLYQIAIEVGFCDQSYFGLVFRRFVKTTPAAYRRMRKGEGAAPQNSTPPGPESESQAAFQPVSAVA